MTLEEAIIQIKRAPNKWTRAMAGLVFGRVGGDFAAGKQGARAGLHRPAQ